MDFVDALKAGGASATILAIAGIGLKLIQTFCGHRLRSECCGREGTVGVAVEEMTPKGPQAKFQSPRPSLQPVTSESVAVVVQSSQTSSSSEAGTDVATSPPAPLPRRESVPTSV